MVSRLGRRKYDAGAKTSYLNTKNWGRRCGARKEDEESGWKEIVTDVNETKPTKVYISQKKSSQNGKKIFFSPHRSKKNWLSPHVKESWLSPYVKKT